MADGYSWNYVRGDDGNRLPGPEHIGWWAAVAMILSVLLHVGVFIALGNLEIVLNLGQAEELSTGNVNVRRVEVQPMPDAGRLEPDKVVEPPKDTTSLLDEIDLLDALPENEEIDIKTDVDEASFALQMSRPAAEGIKAETPSPTQVKISGIRKDLVGQVCADIRKVRPPEPYKGKGIKYIDEQIQRKAGKAAAGA